MDVNILTISKKLDLRNQKDVEKYLKKYVLNKCCHYVEDLINTGLILFLII